MDSLIQILFLSILCFGLIYWWQSRGNKEFAFIAVKNYCYQMDVELLDQAIYLKALWFKRDDKGQLKIWRTYWFEFSTDGEDRYYGRVITLGNKVLKIELEPHRIN